MQNPVQITFRGIPSSPALEEDIREHVARLERFYDRITRCRVVVETPHRHHQKGKLYHVRVDLTVPGGELVVNREPPLHQTHSDPFVAVRDAFNAVARQLEDFARRQQGRVKTHEEPPLAVVTSLFQGDGYGFVEMPDGYEVYFHRNSVLNGGFEQLAVGSQVRLVVAEGESDKGPQASTVELVRR